MKKILITGSNSYIGIAFENWMKKFDGYSVDTADTMNGNWKSADFSQYDIVFNVAGIAHIKETPEITPLYYSVNRDMVIEIAKHAKKMGVKSFIALSSMSVYGKNTGHIKCSDVPNPVSNYGKSKYQADEELIKLNCDSFKVSVLRPPMVYGKGCKGNYVQLAAFARKFPVFPNYKNERSMIHIDNLCEFVRKLIEADLSGCFMPQDKEYICTSQMVKYIAKVNGKNIRLLKIFNPAIKIFNLTVIQKVFGSLTYEKQDCGFDYWVVGSLKEAVYKTEE